MHLIVMAHRGEAQIFIKKDKLIATDEKDLYQNEQILLLIAGEGPFNIFTKLPYLIGKFKIHLITNYGIAGALNPKLVLGSIYPIRTAYCFFKARPEFHSYTSNTETTYDCITSADRIFSAKAAQKLSHFAAIVDRELWAIARVAKEYAIPFEAFKLISDYANEDTSCFDLKAKALEFSNLMYQHYSQHQQLEEVEIPKMLSETVLPFHASFTQKAQIKKLTQKLAIQDITDFIQNHQLKSSDTLIKVMQDKINPVEKRMNEQLNQHFAAFKNIGANIHVKPGIDSKILKLQMDINSQANIDKLGKILSDFKYEEINKLWDGHIDV